MRGVQAERKRQRKEKPTRPSQLPSRPPTKTRRRLKPMLMARLSRLSHSNQYRTWPCPHLQECSYLLPLTTRGQRGAAVWRVGGRVLYVLSSSSLVIVLIDFFFLVDLEHTKWPNSWPWSSSRVNRYYPQGPCGNPNHPTHSNQDFLSPAVLSINRRSSNGGNEPYEIRIEPLVSVQHPTLYSLHTNTN